ncbi:glycosyltransferase [Candidatus Woesearchaeota archaeon]|nr:glycosyltransferase [Candidatus Woesearchaeota archaeon]
MNFGDILIYSVCYFGLFTAFFSLFTIYENKHRIKNPKAKAQPGVSIIIPAFNEEKNIEKTIKSLLALDYPKEKIQIIVIDDGSTDSTYNMAKKYSKRGVEVYKTTNQGKASALNFGLKKAVHPIVGALDADSFADKNAIKRMVGYFNDKKVMAVTASLRVYKPKTFLERIQMIEYMIGIFLRKVFAFLGSIHVTPGPLSLYRKSFFKKYGGYDEANLTEDIEIALRIQKKGYEIENSVDADVYTIAPYRFKPLFNQRLRWYLGFLENVFNYRELLNPRFGNLGLIILPASFISVLLVISVLFYLLFITLKDILKSLLNFINVGFDLMKIFKINFDLFYLNLGGVFLLTLVSLIMGIAIIMLAKRLSKKKESIKSHFIVYTVVYWILFGVWWIGALFLKITGLRLRWGEKKL